MLSVLRLTQLCVVISSSFKICLFLDDLPTELRWQEVLNEVSEDHGDDDDDDDDGDDDDAEKSSTARTTLRSLNHLISSAKDDVERRIIGVMTRTVESLSVCIRRSSAAVTSPCTVATPWHDVGQLTDAAFCYWLK